MSRKLWANCNGYRLDLLLHSIVMEVANGSDTALQGPPHQDQADRLQRLRALLKVTLTRFHFTWNGHQTCKQHGNCVKGGRLQLLSSGYHWIQLRLSH